MNHAAMPTMLSWDRLRGLVAGTAAAIRVCARLVPAGGPEDKIFPPTYLGVRYATEKRRLGGEIVDAVLLDSVQSQANRLELALKSALERGEICFRLLSVDFAAVGLPHIGRITSLDAPHRVADALFRESFLAGVPFRESDPGRAFALARYTNATPLLAVCPTALVFGVWDSTGPQGGRGARFARALVSEIVGIGAVEGVRTQSRIDPAPVAAGIDIYEAREGFGAPGGWTIRPEEAVVDEKGKPKRYGKKGKASEVNLGNVTPDLVRDDEDGNPVGGGVTISYALQTAVLSLPALRRLRFPIGEESCSRPQADEAARNLLAALALASLVYLREEGYDLRSRCLLVPEEPLLFDVVPGNGSPVVERFALDTAGARGVFQAAVEELRAVGLPWPEPGQEEICLDPSPALVELIRRSEALFSGHGEVG